MKEFSTKLKFKERAGSIAPPFVLSVNAGFIRPEEECSRTDEQIVSE
jgi:hypothetical protein